MSSKLRTYSELRTLNTIEERFRYLALKGQVGDSTFGFDRWMNQMFYQSKDWRQIRRHIIVRDRGCDLGVEDHEIHVGLTIHHLNPITVADLRDGNPEILDPEFLITTRTPTHRAIHYGDERWLPSVDVERRPGDTRLW